MTKLLKIPNRISGESDLQKGLVATESADNHSPQDSIQKSESSMTPAATLLAALAIKRSRQKKGAQSLAADISQVEPEQGFGRMDRLKRKFKRSFSRNAG